MADINTQAFPGYWEGPNQQRTEFAQPVDTGYQTGPNKPPTTSEMTTEIQNAIQLTAGPAPAGSPASGKKKAAPKAPAAPKAERYRGRDPLAGPVDGDPSELRKRYIELRHLTNCAEEIAQIEITKDLLWDWRADETLLKGYPFGDQKYLRSVLNSVKGIQKWMDYEISQMEKNEGKKERKRISQKAWEDAEAVIEAEERAEKERERAEKRQRIEDEKAARDAARQAAGEASAAVQLSAADARAALQAAADTISAAIPEPLEEGEIRAQIEPAD